MFRGLLHVKFEPMTLKGGGTGVTKWGLVSPLLIWGQHKPLPAFSWILDPGLFWPLDLSTACIPETKTRAVKVSVTDFNLSCCRGPTSGQWQCGHVAKFWIYTLSTLVIYHFNGRRANFTSQQDFYFIFLFFSPDLWSLPLRLFYPDPCLAGVLEIPWLLRPVSF